MATTTTTSTTVSMDVSTNSTSTPSTTFSTIPTTSTTSTLTPTPNSTPTPLRILVDMDGTVADFEAKLYQLFCQRYPQILYPLNRLTFEYPADSYALVRPLMLEQGFFASLPPVYGAIEAVTAMIEAGHDVYFCSSPLYQYQHCVVEKYQWLEHYFGKHMTRRLILTKDKTLIKADFLIDDNPHISGSAVPEWQHIVFDQSYNKHVQDKARLCLWSDWATILEAAPLLAGSLGPRGL